MSQTFKILGAFLTYPEADLRDEVEVLFDTLKSDGLLSKGAIRNLSPLVYQLGHLPLMDLQEDYVDLFDRSRSLSLHLFEHIHGESRDRGQAMVDLVTLYEQRGLELTAHELPDFLPLFLEFLSTLEAREAGEFLSETAHVLEALHDRLKKRKSRYACLFDALLDISGRARGRADDVQTIDEDPDDLDALDRQWAEEPVTFGPGKQGCPAAQSMIDRMIEQPAAGAKGGDL